MFGGSTQNTSTERRSSLGNAEWLLNVPVHAAAVAVALRGRPSAPLALQAPQNTDLLTAAAANSPD